MKAAFDGPDGGEPRSGVSRGGDPLAQREWGCEARPGTGMLEDQGGRHPAGSAPSAASRTPGSPGGCSSRGGRREGGGVGAPHLGRGGGLGGRCLQLCPPDIAAAPAAGCRDVAAAGFAVPAAGSAGGVRTGLFSYPLESVCWIPCPSLALPLPPPRALCSVLAGDACGFTVWDR